MSTTVIEWEGRAVPADRKYGAGGNGQKYSESQLLLFVSSMSLAIRKILKHPLGTKIEVLLEMEIPVRIHEDRLIHPCMEALRKSGMLPEGTDIQPPRAVRVGDARGPSRITFYITEGL